MYFSLRKLYLKFDNRAFEDISIKLHLYAKLYETKFYVYNKYIKKYRNQKLKKLFKKTIYL